MKRFKAILTVLSIIAFIVLLSCSKDSGVQSINEMDKFEMLEMNMLNNELPISEFIEATLNQEMQLKEFDLSMCFEQRMHKQNGQKHKRPLHPSPLRIILIQLELSDQQKEEIIVFLQSNRECELAALMDLRSSEIEIISSANQQRQEILTQFKNGEITRQEAMQGIREINRETKIALIENPQRLLTFEAIKECRDVLIENIKSVLTDEQLAKFVELLE